MFRKIKISPTFRRTIIINKRAISKSNNPSSYNYLNTIQTKRQKTESPLNNKSNNNSKRSKLFNASTKVNTTNSNFNDNLYYYPPHKKKFSYLNSLSNEVVLIYEGFNFNKAPSLNRNFSGIRKIIKDNRFNKIKYLDNLFSLSMTKNRIHQSISAKYKDNKITNHLTTTNRLYTRNKSCKEYIIKNRIIKKKNIIKGKITRNINSEIKNNNPYKLITTKETTNTHDKLESNNINNFPTTINQENHKLPELYNTERKNETVIIRRKSNKRNKNFNKSNSFVTKLNTQKFNFEMNDCIFDSYANNIESISSFSKKILHMKIFQGIQKNNLNIILDNNLNKVEKYINHIETNFKKYKKVCQMYEKKHLNYMKFLKIKAIEIDDENKSINSKKINLEFEIDDIIKENIKKQSELEHLIDMRNFLYKVRHKDEQIPNIYSMFYFESKRYLLAKCFLKLFKKNKNTSIIRYLSNIPEGIPDLNKINQSEFLVAQCPPLIINKNNNINLNNEKDKKEIINNKNIFRSDDEFLNIIKFLQDANIALLKESEKIKESIEKYKYMLKNYKSPTQIEFEKNSRKKIETKENELNIVKIKNLELNEEYKYTQEAFSFLDLFYNKNKVSSKKTKIKSVKSTFQDLEYYQKVNYNTIIKKSKHSGLIFFRKLLKYYLSLIKLNAFKSIYDKTHPDYLEDIINFSKYAEQNPDYSYFINRYILKILKLYEYVCNHIYKKYRADKLDTNNLIFINKGLNIISGIRKSDNAKALRKLMEEKRYDVKIKLIEKWKMPPKYIGKKNYIETYCRDLVKAKNKEKSSKKKKTVITQNNKDNDLKDFLYFL